MWQRAKKSSGPFKRKIYDQTDESLYRKQSTHRFLKMCKHWNFGQEKENTDTYFCLDVGITKTNGQSLRKSFEVMIDMFILNSFFFII